MIISKAMIRQQKVHQAQKLSERVTSTLTPPTSGASENSMHSGQNNTAPVIPYVRLPSDPETILLLQQQVK